MGRIAKRSQTIRQWRRLHRPFIPNEDVWREEFAMVRWLEEMGYDVAYVTNMDIDAASELLGGRRLFISMGHDEYWSLPERNAVETMSVMAARPTRWVGLSAAS